MLITKTQTAAIKESEKILATLSHPVRQKILEKINSEREISVTELHTKLKMQQSVCSLHLARLRKYGFVVFTKRSQQVFYSVNNSKLEQIIQQCTGHNNKL